MEVPPIEEGREMLELLENSEHWRKRAEEARAIAAVLNDPAAKAMMLRVGETYDLVAQRAEQRAGHTAIEAPKK